jgi:hypothetical protein
MTTTDLPLVGTIGLTQIGGGVGKLVEIGQFFNGEGFKDWEHAFLLGPNGKILEAEPGGARLGSVDEYENIYWCVNIAAQYTEANLQAVWAGAQKYVGTGYSFLDYEALAVHRLHIPFPGLENYIKDSGHLICSQLCDQAYLDQGDHLFSGVWQGYVTPLGLYNLDQRIKIGTSYHGKVTGQLWRPIARPRTVAM